MNAESELIEKTITFVKETLKHAEGGHDWWHTYRVWSNAKQIGSRENVNMLVVELAALLHDIADAKFYGGDETIGPRMAGEFMTREKVEAAVQYHVVKIIENMSFKNSFEGLTWSSAEMQVVQDADRLDAIGAIGIARAFSFGGFKGRAFYDPGIPPNLSMDKEAYKSSAAPTINHFYEKLLLLKDNMHTQTAKKLAEERHRFMEQFLDHFYREWNGLS
jgi:uncharacterized protein